MISWRQSPLRVLFSSLFGQTKRTSDGERTPVAAIDATDIHGRLGGNMGQPRYEFAKKDVPSARKERNLAESRTTPEISFRTRLDPRPRNGTQLHGGSHGWKFEIGHSRDEKEEDAEEWNFLRDASRKAYDDSD